MKANAACLFRQSVGKARPKWIGKPPAALRADNDLGGMLAPCKFQNFRDEVIARNVTRLSSQLLGKAKGLIDPPQAILIHGLLVVSRHADDGPGSVETGGETACHPHHLVGQRVSTDTNQQPLASRPRAFDGVLTQIVDHLIVHPVCCAAKGEFAKRCQIAEAEKAVGGAPGVRQIDLAFLQPLDEFARRKVNQHHIVGTLQHRVRHPFTNGDTGNLRDEIGKAFKMLDIERRPDIDPAEISSSISW